MSCDGDGMNLYETGFWEIGLILVFISAHGRMGERKKDSLGGVSHFDCEVGHG
jgi:hypothetical protein